MKWNQFLAWVTPLIAVVFLGCGGSSGTSQDATGADPIEQEISERRKKDPIEPGTVAPEKMISSGGSGGTVYLGNSSGDEQ